MLFEELFTLKISILPADSFNPLHKIFQINTVGLRSLRTVPTFRVQTKKKIATKYGHCQASVRGQETFASYFPN